MASKRIQDMTPQERRAHIAPATRARRFNAARRYLAKLTSSEPKLTPAQLRDLSHDLESAAREQE